MHCTDIPVNALQDSPMPPVKQVCVILVLASNSYFCDTISDVKLWDGSLSFYFIETVRKFYEFHIL